MLFHFLYNVVSENHSVPFIYLFYFFILFYFILFIYLFFFILNLNYTHFDSMLNYYFFLFKSRNFTPSKASITWQKKWKYKVIARTFTVYIIVG